MVEIWARERRNATPEAGPFLFGDFGAVDCMFAPVVLRFHSYKARGDSGGGCAGRRSRAHAGGVGGGGGGGQGKRSAWWPRGPGAALSLPVVSREKKKSRLLLPALP